MKALLLTVVSLFALAVFAQAAAEPQTFPTSAGPVKIIPLNHASTLIEAGGKIIYLDPAKPVNFDPLPKADLILITDIHGDHMDPDSIKAVSKGGTEIFASPAVVQTVTTAKPIANEISSSGCSFGTLPISFGRSCVFAVSKLVSSTMRGNRR